MTDRPDTHTPPGHKDVLDSLLQGLRLRTSVFHRGTFCGAWTLDTSGSGRAAFHLVLSGSCWLHFPTLPSPQRLAEGDLVLFPRDASHTIASDPEALSKQTPPATTLPLDAQTPVPGTALVCGHFEFAARGRNALLDALPECVVFRAGERSSSWPYQVVNRIFDEAREPRPASSVIIERLVDLLFVEALRTRLTAEPGATGILAALCDPQLHRALAACRT